METNVNEFVVRSMRHCFICLNQIPSHFENGAKPDQGPIYSLHSLSRYLKMDMGTVFHGSALVPQHLLDKVRKSKLKGEMCLECALLNETISEKHQNLVKIELELISSLKAVQNKLSAANATEKSTKLRQLAASQQYSKDGWVGKLDILDVLRAEAVQKCSRKLIADTPRVKVANLTPSDIINEKLKFQRNSFKEIQAESHDMIETDFSLGDIPDPNIELGNVKTETPFVDSLPDWDDDTQSIENSDKLGTSSHSPNTSHRRQNLKSIREKNDDQQGYSFDVVIPPSSSKVPKPEPTFDLNTKKYKCNLCPSERINMSLFKVHYESAHLNVKYKCNICGREFTQRCQYNLHHRTIHVGVRVQCLGCNKIFKYKSELTKHQRKDDCCKRITKTEAT